MTSTDTNPPAAAKKQKTAGTEYIVLGRSTGLDEAGEELFEWVVVTQIKAASREAAVREAAKESHFDTLVAIPARFWQPVRVKVETVQRIKLEDA